jgi:hypothetical protein
VLAVLRTALNAFVVFTSAANCSDSSVATTSDDEWCTVLALVVRRVPMKRHSTLVKCSPHIHDERMVAKVVVPLYGSDVSARALGPAHALAARTDAELVLLTTRWECRRRV